MRILLAEAGYDSPPTNNAELVEIAQALTTDDRDGLLVPVAGGFPIWMYQSFAIAYGREYRERPTRPRFISIRRRQSPRLNSCVRLGTDLGVGTRGGAAWGDTPVAFLAGQAAMIYHTTGNLEPYPRWRGLRGRRLVSAQRTGRRRRRRLWLADWRRQPLHL